MSPLDYVLWAALAIGMVFGACGQATRFCLQRGLAQVWAGQAAPNLRAFAMALAIALLGTQICDAYGLIHLQQSVYRGTSFSWLLLPLGGTLFGLGMGLCNGCGARALVLLAQGNLRSLFVLLCLGIAGLATLTGTLAPLRLFLSEWSTVSLSASTPAHDTLRYTVTAVIVLALFAYALRGSQEDRMLARLLAAGLIGLMVVAGWLSTGYLGADDFDPQPLASLSFVAPVGDTVQYTMIATGMSLRFGIVIVIGVFIGAWLSAGIRREWRWEGFESSTQMRRYLVGGTLMGVGGALALGCSIGQGLTGLSTLAYGSFIATAGIVLGSRLAHCFTPYRAN